MMGAFYSGVSGLKSQTYALDVISNNIANVSTTGYKAQRVSFSDLLSQTLSAATAPDGNLGGTNAEQIGLGVGINSTDINMTQGSSESTGVDTDVAISGDGFLVVQGGSQGQYQYTRDGELTIDSNGNITVNGYKVCGWDNYTESADGTYANNTDKSVAPLNIYSGTDASGNTVNKKIMAPEVTTTSTFSGNLPSSVTASTTASSANSKTSTVSVYDAQGNEYDLSVTWSKTAVNSDGTTDWTWTAATPATTAAAKISLSNATGTLEFDSSGKIVTTKSADSATPAITITPASTVGTAAFTDTLNFTGLSTYNASSTTDSSIIVVTDGCPAGTLQSEAIGSDGTITGTYSNGKTQPLGQIAVADFTNSQGLNKIGSNLYATSNNSGAVTYNVPGSSGTGTLSADTLEASNVDLANELSQMMITERAYQGNTKAISTADEMLQYLLQMKS